MKKAISEFFDREAAVKERQLLLDRWNRHEETAVNWLEKWGTNKEISCPTNQN